MSERMGPYDTSLQMFVQKPQPIDMKRLTFMRWLAEQGRLEHKVAGLSSGPLAPVASEPEPEPEQTLAESATAVAETTTLATRADVVNVAAMEAQAQDLSGQDGLQPA